MASGILGTAVSGLMAFQRSLDTTSHNIANVNTEGFSRQRVDLATKPAEFIGAGFVGTGVNITNISRSYDQFITNQLRTSTAAFGEVDQYQKLATQVDSVLADPGTGLAPAIKNLFNAVNDVANDPSSIPARQVLLSEAQNLSQSFNGMNQRFEDLQAQTNNDMKVKVEDVNTLARSIADLNQRIAADIGRANGTQQPNDLLDQRDLLLTKLSELVDVSVVPQANGMSSVFIGKGQSLVLDGTASALTVITSEFDPTQLGIALKTPTGNQDITGQLNGGSLAGALRFRDEVLNPARQQLGQVAAGLALEFNALHETGFDLDGNQGQALFSFNAAAVPVVAGPANTGAAVVSAQFQDPNNPLTPDAVKNLDFSDFELSFDGANYTLTRVRDQQIINLTPVATATPGVFDLTFSSSSDPTITALPGFSLSLDTTAGAAIAGDRFLARPTFNAAQKIGVAIDDPRKIAAATNVEVDPVTGQPVLDGLGNPVIINGPLPGDNRNALQLAELENKLSLLGGNASFKDAYGQIVSGVGTLTRSANLSALAQQTLLTQAQAARENLAGVNLDEEAANLIKFQQSYQAAAQAISIASSLFDTLLGAVR
ncbi:MAG: flagellar hook-associated protein FlgK [Gammaproteobacteria bacterium HGW-Gammaproteobacteria-3]|nr:MAG: flagellar hook-associated protein FlgK [Gammaproteobacteria bacterium HGW-Gammaproteobacteria-3]